MDRPFSSGFAGDFRCRPVFADDANELSRRLDIHLQKAKALILSKDMEGARAEIMDAIALKADVAEYWRILGGVDEYLDAHYEENLNAWRTFLKLEPNSPKKDSILDKIADLENKIEAQKRRGGTPKEITSVETDKELTSWENDSSISTRAHNSHRCNRILHRVDRFRGLIGPNRDSTAAIFSMSGLSCKEFFAPCPPLGRRTPFQPLLVQEFEKP